MNFLFFEDDELEKMINIINEIQVIYHPKYAPIGKFSFNDMETLRNKNVLIILDNNLVSPIYDFFKKADTKNIDGLRIAAIVILFSKFINARVSGGLAFIENDMNTKVTISSNEKNAYLLFALDKIPSMFWKKIVFGQIEPLTTKVDLDINEEKSVFQIEKNIHFLMHKIAMTKIVWFLRNKKLKPFDKFMQFMEWYVKRLIITESIIVYALMIFHDTENIKKPKDYQSKKYDKVLSGIENEAWDIFYISNWSSLLGNSKNNETQMLASNDITLKSLIVNSAPVGKWGNVVEKLIKTKKQKQIFEKFYENSFEANRIKPIDLSDDKTFEKLTLLLEEELAVLKNEI